VLSLGSKNLHLNLAVNDTSTHPTPWVNPEFGMIDHCLNRLRLLVENRSFASCGVTSSNTLHPAGVVRSRLSTPNDHIAHRPARILQRCLCRENQWSFHAPCTDENWMKFQRNRPAASMLDPVKIAKNTCTCVGEREIGSTTGWRNTVFPIRNKNGKQYLRFRTTVSDKLRFTASRPELFPPSGQIASGGRIRLSGLVIFFRISQSKRVNTSLGTKKMAHRTLADESSTRVRLDLLGGFSVRCDGRSVLSLPRKATALLAYLVLQDGRPAPRDVIVELLWPEKEQSLGRTNLRQLHSALRRHGLRDDFGLRDVSNGLALPADVYDADVLELRRCAKSATRESLRRAAEIYRGNFLHGLGPISEDFDTWSVSVQSEIERLAVQLLVRLVDLEVDAGNFESALEFANRIVAIDPLREDGHRQAMKAYRMAGRRADALRHYETAKEILWDELGVEPEQETIALAEELRKDSSSDVSVHLAAEGHGRSPRVAVIPFEQFSGCQVPEHLSDGLVADVISQLSGLTELSVISHGSTGDLSSTTEPRTISRQLGVRYILRGSMRRLGPHVRLTTELVDANSCLVVGSCISNIGDKFSFDDQDRVVAQIVNSLAPRVGEMELERIRGKRPCYLSVYEKVLLARLNMRSIGGKEFKNALPLLEEVIQEDPAYAEAYGLAADWHGLAAAEDANKREMHITASEALARNALEFDRNNIRALTFYAHRRSLFHRDFNTACALFDRALTSAPHSCLTLRWSSLTYSFIDASGEAINRAEKALSLSPRDVDAHSFYLALVIAYYTAAQFDIAADYAIKLMSEQPVLPSSGGWAAASLAASGRLQEARTVAHDTMLAQPSRRVSEIVKRHPYRDPNNRMAYGKHLLLAGFPD